MRYAAALLLTLAMSAGCGLSIVGAAGTGKDDDASTSAPPAPEAGTTTPPPTGGDAASTPPPPAPVAPVFPEECPPATRVTDDFSFDPAGRWFTVAATWIWDKDAKTLTVTGFDPHGLVWLGARPQWKDVRVDAEIKLAASTKNSANAGILLRIGSVGTVPAANNDGQMYLAAVKFGNNPGLLYGKEDDGWDALAETDESIVAADTWTTLSATITGPNAKMLVNGKSLDGSDGAFKTGSVGFKVYQLGLTIRKVTVTCL